MEDMTSDQLCCYYTLWNFYVVHVGYEEASGSKEVAWNQDVHFNSEDLSPYISMCMYTTQNHQHRYCYKCKLVSLHIHKLLCERQTKHLCSELRLPKLH